MSFRADRRRLLTGNKDEVHPIVAHTVSTAFSSHINNTVNTHSWLNLLVTCIDRLRTALTDIGPRRRLGNGTRNGRCTEAHRQRLLVQVRGGVHTPRPIQVGVVRPVAIVHNGLTQDREVEPMAGGAGPVNAVAGGILN